MSDPNLDAADKRVHELLRQESISQQSNTAGRPPSVDFNRDGFNRGSQELNPSPILIQGAPISNPTTANVTAAQPRDTFQGSPNNNAYVNTNVNPNTNTYVTLAPGSQVGSAVRNPVISGSQAVLKGSSANHFNLARFPTLDPKVHPVAANIAPLDAQGKSRTIISDKQISANEINTTSKI